MNIGIIGAGATGLTASYELIKKGHSVTVFETDEKVGGLVKSIAIGDTEIESFYHHIFTNDLEVISLVEELGLSSSLKWYTPKSGLFINNKLYPFSSPMDLLMFNELPFIERIRLGLLVYIAKFVKDWRSLESVDAKDWVIKNAGKNAYNKFWGPLMNSKFDSDSENISAVWLWNKFKLRGSTRGKNITSEMFGYMDGSYSRLYEALKNKIISNGGKVLTSNKVLKIQPQSDKTINVSTNDNTYIFDKVIFTSAPNLLKDTGVIFENSYQHKLDSIKYKSNICMLLELTHSMSPYYWITVAEKDYPFVLTIEHTNLVSDEKYKSNIFYLSRYLDETNEIYSYSDERLKELFLKSFKKMFPKFDTSMVKGYNIVRSKYAQPVVVKEYSKILPELSTPIPNLYVANMSQIYPEDRGQNYSIKLGKTIANEVLK